jgi:hypothetical protein
VAPLPSDEPASGRFIGAALFVASAAAAAAMLRFAWLEPLPALGLLAIGLGALGLRWRARRRLRALLRSGDVELVLRRWSPSFARLPYGATMTPLMTATAFAAYGWIDRARELLAAAERGPAWEAALEHRLFLDAMLHTFEGDPEEGIALANRLERLPLPPSGRALRRRVWTLRRAIGALARAFAHRAVAGDEALLEQASETSPLVFWAMRYAAAVVAFDRGDLARTRELLRAAPRWPEQSAFCGFHDELAARAGLAAGAGAAPVR